MNEIPQARDSEMALLGAILIDPSIIDLISLEPSAFYDIGNQTIYASMRTIGSRELDIVVLSELLERKGKLDQIGGNPYLISLPNVCPQSYNYQVYERAILDTAIRRRVIQLCGELAREAFDEQKPINDAISLAVSELVRSAEPRGGAVHLADYLKRMDEQIEERAQNPVEIYGLETGLVDFDKITHGLQKGEEFILAGQPGTGKSLLAFQMGCAMAERGHPGAVYALEMSGVAMVRRQLSATSGIPTYNLRSGVDMNERWEAYCKAVEKMEQLPVYISDTSNWTTIQMRADLSRLKLQFGVEWFVVDYHDLLTDNYGKDGIEKSAYLSQQLHMICKDLNLAGLVIQSLNKQGYGRTPTMANLSGSTKVMHTADHIVFMVKKEDEPNIVRLVWDKVREGDESFQTMRLVKIEGFPAFANYKKPESGQQDYSAVYRG